MTDKQLNRKIYRLWKQFNFEAWKDSDFKYRLYKRGKNRCLACGLKLEDCRKENPLGLHAMAREELYCTKLP